MNSNSICSAPFGSTSDGHAVEAYTLTSPTGTSATVITYGGILTKLIVPDKNGALGDVTLGFDNLEQYETQNPYFGAIVGRFANRIAEGKFSLHDKAHALAANNGRNHLHGGLKGYDKRIWAAERLETEEGPAVRLTLVDPDGTENYPGTVRVAVTYTLIENTHRIEYLATTDKPTPINLTNHAYFNLKDAGKSDILSHVMQVNADFYTPVDTHLIPTGEIAPVKNTPLDFRAAKRIGRDLFGMPGTPHGYDHNVVLNGQKGALAHAATITEPTTGRRLELWTTQPGLQLYTANFLDGSLHGKGNMPYQQHHAFCLETQHFPDAVNHPHFPSTILHPGETYRHTTEFRFSISP